MPQVDYIATVEASSVNPDGSTPDDGVVLLDAVPVSSLDRIRATLRESRGAVAADKLDYLLLQVPVAGISSVLSERPGWFRIRVSDDGSPQVQGFEAFAPFFGASTDGQGIPLRVELPIEDVSRRDLAVLERIGSLPALRDAAPEEIADILDVGSPAAIGIYDVGQGSFSAIVDGAEHPLLFFDLGWSLPSKASSRPAIPRFDPFARGLDVPVVLSHLDFDHWGYAIESGQARWDPGRMCWRSVPVYRKEALERPWLMRRPNVRRHKLGPWHLHFALTLAESRLPDARSVLHIWPERKASVRAGSITVFKCRNRTGRGARPSYLRNNESLGLCVQQGIARVLLCGDADYPSIPWQYKQRLVGMIAPHHGGATTRGAMPPAVGHGRMVLSTYQGAYRGIPHANVLKEARQSGWAVARTDDRYPCARCGALHGHRMIRIGMTPRCTCNMVPDAQLCITKP